MPFQWLAVPFQWLVSAFPVPTSAFPVPTSAKQKSFWKVGREIFADENRHWILLLTVSRCQTVRPTATIPHSHIGSTLAQHCQTLTNIDNYIDNYIDNHTDSLNGVHIDNYVYTPLIATLAYTCIHKHWRTRAYYVDRTMQPCIQPCITLSKLRTSRCNPLERIAAALVRSLPTSIRTQRRASESIYTNRAR